MKALIRMGFLILALPTILLLVTGLVNKIMTPEVTITLRNVAGRLDGILGTRVVNLMLATFMTIAVINVAKWLFKFITGNLYQEEN